MLPTARRCLTFAAIAACASCSLLQTRPQDTLKVNVPETWRQAGSGTNAKISTGWLSEFNSSGMTSVVNQALASNRNLQAAAEMLGRPYTVLGTVVKGRQLGGKIGVPTANIEVGSEQLPPDGVYVVEVALNGDRLPGVGNLGMRPTVNGKETLSEPSSLVAVRATSKLPSLMKTCDGFWSTLVAPSPKSQAHDVGSPVDVSVNWIERPTVSVNGDQE